MSVRPSPRFPLLAAALLAAPAAATQVVPGADVSIGGGVSVPPTSYTGLFSRVVAGELTGDLSTDAVFLVGTTALLLHTPEAYGTLLSFPVAATDLDVLEGGGPDGRDALVVVNANGLWRTWWTAAGFGWQRTDLAAWHGAKLVRAGDVSGDGLADVVGLAADGVTVLGAFGRADGGFHGARVLFVATDPVRALELCDWDGDGDAEIATLTTTEARVQAPLGASLATAPLGAPGGAICVLDEPGTAAQRLVVCAHVDASADQWLWVSGQSGTEAAARLGPLDVVGLATADLGGNGRAELLVSHRGGPFLGIVQNASGNGGVTYPLPPEGLTGGIDIEDEGYDPALNEAVPCVADFDGDGDADVLHGLEGVGKLILWDGRAVPHWHLEPAVESARLVVRASGAVELGVSFGAPAQVPAGVNALQVVAWREETFDAGTDPGALQNKLYPLPAQWPLVVIVPLPEEDEEFETVYSLLVRQVRVVENEVVEQHRARTLAYAQDESFAMLSVTAGAGAYFDVPLEFWQEDGTILPDSIAGSGLIELPKLPDFPEEEAPEEGEPETGS